MTRKVVMVCSSLNWGGTEKWTLKTCEELTRQGFEVTLVVSKTDLWTARSDINFNLVTLPFKNDADLVTIFNLINLFRKKADIVIPTRVRDYLLAGFAARVTGKKVLLRLGVVRRLRDNYILDRLRYGIFPHAILVNANAIKNELLKTSWMKNKNYFMLRNGVESPGNKPSDETEEIRKKINVKSDDILFLGVGRLAHEKRFDWLIKTVKILRGKGISAKGCILGEGSLKNDLSREISEFDLQEHVLLPGTHLDVSSWYQAADIILLPSNNEGISNVMLEAMGHAKPVLATISGGVKEVFTDKNEVMLVSTNDFEEFVKRAEELALDKELCIRIGASAHKRTVADFNWSSMAKKLQIVFNELDIL